MHRAAAPDFALLNPGYVCSSALRAGEMFAQARLDLIVGVGRAEFHILHPGFAQGFFFDCVARGGGALIVTLALILDRQEWPSAAIDNEDVNALAVDRVKRVLLARSQNFAKAGLREDAITCALGGDLLFDDGEDTIFRRAKHALLLECAGHDGVQLLPDIGQVGPLLPVLARPRGLEPLLSPCKPR